MSIEDVGQVYEIARVHDHHIVSHWLDGTGDDVHGWVKATVDGFEADDDGKVKMIIELPWGERHVYGWSHDNIADGPLSRVCSAYGYSISEFERLTGEDIWLKVRYVTLDEDGDIDTGTTMVYPKTAVGPNYWKKWVKWFAVSLVAVIVVLLI